LLEQQEDKLLFVCTFKLLDGGISDPLKI
jgi:hypothetical protein